MPNANTPEEKKWYVFDEYDCFSDYPLEQGQQAMDAAVGMEREGMTGVHVVCMTEKQFNDYCTNGDLKQALKNPE